MYRVMHPISRLVGSGLGLFAMFFIMAVGFLGSGPSIVYAATLDCNTASNINVPVAECQALLDLYDSTNGISWNSNTNRDTDTDVCTWQGISCTSIMSQDRVTTISLPFNNLVGSLPSGLSNLTELQHIDFLFNQISGPLPDSWSGMINLISASFAVNQISGPLPDSWGNLTNLTIFSLSNNQISGPLPDAWSGMTSLTNFSISYNQINGSLPSSWSTMSSLQIFDASYNQIGGSLPDAWSGMTNMQQFFINNNNIVGSLVDSWSAWSLIQWFFSSDNDISGQLPDSWSSRTAIDHFNISNNYHTGYVPDSWSSTWTNVTSSNALLASNCLEASGYMPAVQSWIDTLITINPQYICLSYSTDGHGSLIGDTLQRVSLSGDGSSISVIPDPGYSFIGRSDGSIDNPRADLTVTGHINVTAQFVYDFCGTATNINVPVTDCQVLIALYDSTNGSGWFNNANRYTDTDVCTWNGVSCTFTGGQNRVISLSLVANNLSGTLPSSLSQLSELTALYLNNNDLSGPLPNTLPITLQYVYLSNNHFSSQLPDSWSSLTNLTQLGLSYNNLNGSLPDGRSGMLNIQYMNLDHNNFTDSLPDSRSTWTDLYGLNLESGGTVTGLIPSSWFTGLPDRQSQYINLGYNCLATLGYTTLEQDWINDNIILSPQNCYTVFYQAGTGGSISGSAIQTILPGGDTEAVEAIADTGYIFDSWDYGLSTDNPFVITGVLFDIAVIASFDGNSCATYNNITVPVAECEALMDLYNSTDGPSWSNSSNRATDSNVCTWHGISCTTDGSGQNRVSSISLGAHSLSGTLPGSLGQLSFLTYLDIGSNQISGPLPDPRSGMTSLSDIRFPNNQISGPLPDAWANLSLTSIEAQNNKLSGSLPDSWSVMTSLTTFIASNNNFSGPLPDSWSSLTQMTTFNASNNNFVGTLPASWSAWTTLYPSIDVSYNYLTGTIPWASAFNNLGSTYIYLDHNCLETSTSGYAFVEQLWIAMNVSLTPQELCLSYTVDTGAILSGQTLQRLSSGSDGSPVEVILFSGATLSGRSDGSTDNPRTDTGVTSNISVHAIVNPFVLDCMTAVNINVPVAECQALMDLYNSAGGTGWTISTNRATDTDVCTRLNIYCINNRVVAIPLPNKNLVGTIPFSIFTDITGLVYLDLSNNQLTGTLPSGTGVASTIQTILLSNNQLSDTLPSSWGSFSNIVTIDLSGNQLYGQLPDAWNTLSTLTILNLSNNQFAGTLPDAWSGMTSLTGMYLNNNQFTGTLPSAWSTLTNMETFSVADNLLVGQLPSSRSAWTTTYPVIDVSYNFFTGYIPSSWINTFGMNGSAYMYAVDTCIERVGYFSPEQIWIDTSFSIMSSFACLSYISSSGGTLSGDTFQIVVSGNNGLSVSAIPLNGYAFSSRSDGSIANPRIDLTVTGNITVTAQFAPVSAPTTGSSGSGGGGGGGVLSATVRDNCVVDNSPSYYDSLCEMPSSTTSSGINSATGSSPIASQSLIPLISMDSDMRKTLEENLTTCESSYETDSERAYCLAEKLGYDTKKGPSPLSRASFASLIYRFTIAAGGVDTLSTDECDFADVRLRGLRGKSIQKLCQMGIMGMNTSDERVRNFYPHSLLTKKEFLTVVSRIIGGGYYDTASSRQRKYTFANKHITHLLKKKIISSRASSGLADVDFIYVTLYNTIKYLLQI